MLINIDAGLLDIHMRKTITNLEQSGYFSFLPVFNTLFDHGFRINELSACHTWVFLNQDQVIASTSKGSQDRIIQTSELHPLIIQSINEGSNYLFKMSYPTYERAFRKHSPALRYFVKSKEIGTHLFRHNFIKQLSISGLTVSAIRTITGIKTDSIVQGYIQSNLKAHVI